MHLRVCDVFLLKFTRAQTLKNRQGDRSIRYEQFKQIMLLVVGLSLSQSFFSVQNWTRSFSSFLFLFFTKKKVTKCVYLYQKLADKDIQINNLQTQLRQLTEAREQENAVHLMRERHCEQERNTERISRLNYRQYIRDQDILLRELEKDLNGLELEHFITSFGNIILVVDG